jgi:uncharacterized protein (UPF0218 family)
MSRRDTLARRTLVLPLNMRSELKEPLGRLLRGEPSETVEELRRILSDREPPMLAVVGDFTTKNVLESGLKPDVVVVDNRVMRVDVDPLDHKERQILRCENRQGTVNARAWAVLEEAVSLKSSAAVIVEGEEDLLVLPLILLMPEGALIVYGQPREGMVVVDASGERKEWAEEFLARMEES